MLEKGPLLKLRSLPLASLKVTNIRTTELLWQLITFSILHGPGYAAHTYSEMESSFREMVMNVD